MDSQDFAEFTASTNPQNCLLDFLSSFCAKIYHWLATLVTLAPILPEDSLPLPWGVNLEKL